MNDPLTWSFGSFLYSFAVSIKMNILLYAPAIGLLYFKYLGFIGTIQQIIICVITQVLHFKMSENRIRVVIDT